MSKYKQKNCLLKGRNLRAELDFMVGGHLPVICSPNRLDLFHQIELFPGKRIIMARTQCQRKWERKFPKTALWPWSMAKVKGVSSESRLILHPNVAEILQTTNQPTNKLICDNKLKFWTKWNVHLMMVLKGQGIAVIITVQSEKDMNVCTKSGGSPTLETFH